MNLTSIRGFFLVILKKTRYLTFAALVIFLICELILRLFFSENLVLHDYPKVYSFDPVLGHRGIPHSDGHIRRPSIDKHFTLNNFGFYGSDFQAEHPDSIFRIGVFGASRVEGVWANQIESFPGLLNNLFGQKGYRVEVLNLGVSGAGRDLQNISLIMESVSRFKLNMALMEGSIPLSSIRYYRDRYKGYSILFTGNDSLEYKRSWAVVKKKIDLLNKYKLYTTLWDMSYVVRYLAKHADNDWGTVADCLKNYSDNSVESWQYYSTIEYDTGKSLETLNNLQLYLDKSNCKLGVFSYRGDSLLKSLENNDHIKFAPINLNIDLNQQKYRHNLDGHPNLLADQLISDHFYKELVKYIPQQFK